MLRLLGRTLAHLSTNPPLAPTLDPSPFYLPNVIAAITASVGSIGTWESAAPPVGPVGGMDFEAIGGL